MLINTKQSEILLSLFARVLSCPPSPVYMWKSFLVCLFVWCSSSISSPQFSHAFPNYRVSGTLWGNISTWEKPHDSLQPAAAGYKWQSWLWRVVTAELSLHGQRRPFFLEPLLSALLCRLVFIWSCYKKYKRIYWNHSVLISDLLDKNALSVWKWVAVNVFFFIYYSLQWQSLIFVSQCAV